ncbi:MAG: four-carbon acid sugar kinase family protein, partial [Trebonia sp.]
MSGPPFTAAFYGDDLTGSTDALAQFHRAGLRGLLVTSPEAIGLGAGYDVIGIAGISRSLPTARMADELLPAFRALREMSTTVVQYKVCSTADSSPAVGSLGRAIELGREVFGEVPVPVLIAQPDLGRYTAFGNHFAAEGEEIYRLYRQPTMSRHPSTPVTEGDLRRHIGAQTDLPVASVDVTAYDSDPLARYRTVTADDPGAIVFDAMDNTHLRAVGEVILAAAPRRPAFVLGAGGLSWSLGTALAGTRTGSP